MSPRALMGAGTDPIVERDGILSIPHNAQERNMAWKTPKIVEVSLALEINSYACAEIG
ncbi:pyrroloquinoline quinone precursor peptide PqqA [Roseococcus thiosulfatophilus]|uniref:pyrroloquinoline quinone precursor peptide PqqA n=1 Tax=Roseococcus thiosulfatophilus TaxID=35813 RepID=UPI001A909111|nr:pyrroloquinoline quinone precursor peptide PqqA [Roseococcus thiosulfatophilus]